MAIPPAPTAASVEAARIRAGSSQMENALEQLVRAALAERKSVDSELSDLLVSQRKLDENIGKGQNDAFVKLADLNTQYGKVLAGGSVNPIDKLKYVVDILKLQKDVNQSINRTNNLRLDQIIAQAEAQTGEQINQAGAAKRAFELFIQDAAASPYNPTLVGDFDKLMNRTGAAPTSFPIEGMDEVIKQYNDRKDAAAELNNNAKYLESQFGADAFTNLSSMVGSGNITSDVQRSLGSIPNEVFDNLREVSKKLPGLGDLAERRRQNDERIAVLRGKLSGDLMAEIQTNFAKMSGGQGFAAKSRISAMARLVGRPKFQEWAASNGLKVGTTRPADRPGDKDLPGYDSATNTVYVPGPDDERAVRVAMRQSTLRPERQILPRRGLEARRVLSVQVGEPSPDAAKVNKDGKYRMLDGQYVTDAEIEAARDKKTTAEVSAATGGKVFKMKDGSFAFISDSPDSDLEPISAEDPRVKAAKFSPAVVAPDNETLGVTEAELPAPTATRTITGRETALLPSDPEGATVLETADGRRIVIPKEQTVDVSEVTKAAPLEGETTSRGIRMPFAALRARRAGVDKTPTEAEVEALPEAGAPSLRVPETGVGLPKRGTPTRQEMLEQNIVPMPAPTPVATKTEAASLQSTAVPMPNPALGPSTAVPMPMPRGAATVAPTPMPITRGSVPVEPTPMPAVRVTPGEEAGKDVRDAIGAPTGATAPQPVGVANGGSKASVPSMPMSALDRIRSMRLQAPPASPAQAPTVSTTEEPVAVFGQPSETVRTPMTPKATARAEKVVERAGVTASERLDAARRKRIAAAAAEEARRRRVAAIDAAAASKGDIAAYDKQFAEAERASAAARAAAGQ